MSNRWVIEAQQFCGLSITHRWHRLVIDLLITHRWPMDYSSTFILHTEDTFLAFLYLLFRLWFFYLCQTHFSSCLKFLLTMSRHKVLITNTDDSQNTGKKPAITQIEILWISALQEKGNELLHQPQIGGRNFCISKKWPLRPCTKTTSIHHTELLKNLPN